MATEVSKETELLRAVGTNTYKWVYETAIIDKNNIDDYEILTNRRDIRSGHVRKLRKLLEAGKHFESALVVNRKGKKLRLIDGNHRIEAIRLFLEMYPERKVKCGMHVYDNLDEEAERETYKTWNSGLRQSTNDFIKQYWDEVPFFKRVQKATGFPHNTGVTWSTHQMEARLLIGAYFGSKLPVYNGPFAGNGESFIEESRKLKKDDATLMKGFMLEYINIFSAPEKTNNYYRPTIFSGMMDIWMKNYNRVPAEIMQKKMKAVLGNAFVVQWGPQSGTIPNCVLARRDLLSVMNKVQAKHVLV